MSTVGLFTDISRVGRADMNQVINWEAHPATKNGMILMPAMGTILLEQF